MECSICLLPAVILVLSCTQAPAACFTGRVERVIDGDTIIVGTNRVRLAEIDTPELNAPYGAEAKKALSDMILRRTVVVEWKRRGRYRRIIGQVYLKDNWINRDLVEMGWAQQFTRYSDSGALSQSQESARRRHAGRWRSPPTNR